MTLRRKLQLLAMSLLLPAVLLACTHVFVAALMRVGDSDRAIVWAQGEPSAIAAVRRQVESNQDFRNGRVEIPALPRYRPADCAPEAVELSFGGLGAHDAQAARDALESHAEQGGLQICATDIFLLNDTRTDDAAGRARFVAMHLLLYLVVPGGVALCVFWMFREQFALPAPFPAGSAARGLAWGLAALPALVAMAAAINLAFGLPWPGDRPGLAPGTDAATVGMVLALVALSPLFEETACRGWLIPLAERAIGPWAAAALSSFVFAASHLPASEREWGLGLMLGAVCSLLYLRTRSLWAPITANAGFSLLMLAASTALR
ncbi:CPBP family intramembrane glutamic endopeptidase [Arenimonas terrae]|jgi:membrane protease YdiL (CAAX protease family)|uniref:CPBP family intramembrane metalloprotease n=1 Tax=Arenimonas terrae TaxID=2546226 RepID=A0A5C4RTT5_9GAMM|nr:type II CAAX endopeptidase family protein [Arenimonas terrae]TNJ34590.1 CPBP family intramembrane metalloprotease [Arenimonas terrae]